MMRRSVSVALAAVFVLAAFPARAAYQDAVTVSAYDQGPYDLFAPAEIELRRGGTVTFEFDGPSVHTATDGSGLDLYDSGVALAGDPDEVVTYAAAGTYDVVCDLHSGMDATVYVPVGVAPPSAPIGASFTVTWASQSAPAGFVYDVQRRRPDGRWRPWRDDTSERSAISTPQREGVWRFRARLERVSTGATSAWSPVATSTVT